jgi:hypothetical protein
VLSSPQLVLSFLHLSPDPFPVFRHPIFSPSQAFATPTLPGVPPFQYDAALTPVPPFPAFPCVRGAFAGSSSQQLTYLPSN